MGRRSTEYDDGLAEDKQWAKKYILDPLTAPEPSQETGPGSSFFNPQRSLSYRAKEKAASTAGSRRRSGYPTPPQSASPSRSSFHSSNPFSSPTSSRASRVSPRAPALPPFDWAPASAILARKNSFDSQTSSGRVPSTPRSPEPGPVYPQEKPLPIPPEKRPVVHSPNRLTRASSERYPLRVPQKLARRSFDQQPPERLQRPYPERLTRHSSERNPLRVPEKPVPQSPERRSPERRSPDWYVGSPVERRNRTVKYPPQTHCTQGSADTLITLESVSRSNSLQANGNGLRRSNSLNQRYPGDMSHRPLDIIRREKRAADHPPHRRRNIAITDTIDSLDQSAIGGSYHHGGPYDATLASRNTNKLYSPVEAVKESNIEALKATPREYINDSLAKHVPLQGTATVPPGMADMRGHVMEYEEGADLMREGDAPGGAYRRWDCIPYHPDDLKGKGEPSYTVERDLKEHEHRKLGKQRASISNADEYEMQPRRNSTLRKSGGVMVRQRSVSSAAADRSGPSAYAPLSPPTSPPAGFSASTDLRRSNTTGNRFAEGLKRRFGSLRRKKSIQA